MTTSFEAIEIAETIIFSTSLITLAATACDTLEYAGEPVLPFYILHQTVLLSVGYFVMRWQIPDLLKWAINAGLSFAAIMLIYEYGVRRWNVMRFLFGMKLRKQPVQVTRLIRQTETETR